MHRGIIAIVATLIFLYAVFGPPIPSPLALTMFGQTTSNVFIAIVAGFFILLPWLAKHPGKNGMR